MLDLLGKMWALPNTLIGLGAGAVGVAFGARMRCAHNAMVFFDYPFGPGGAITLGNVILTTETSLDLWVTDYLSRCRPTIGSSDRGSAAVHLGKHEEAHTYQYQLLGPAFLLVYWIAGIGRTVSALEAAADHYAQTGEGWWPWRLLR